MLKKLLVISISMLLIPSLVSAATSLRIDMDANTAGYQDTILLLPGQSFTSNIEVVMDDAGDSLSSFGYSVWWDAGELNAPMDGDISSSALTDGWTDLGYFTITSPYIYDFAQVNFASSSGPLTATVASIYWTAYYPTTNGSLDINLGFFNALDGAFDGGGSQITPTFQGGTVNLAPEPISSILFLTGGATLGFRSLRKKKIAK